MKKYLYILKTKGSSIVMHEDEKLKYFEGEDTDHLERVEKYIKDKMEYSFLKIIKEKDVIYYGDEYKVILIDVLEYKGVTDRSALKAFNEIKSEDIGYRDFRLLNIFCSYEFITNDFELNKQEKQVTIKNTIMAVLIGLITIILFVGNNEFNYFGISVPIIVTIISASAIFSIGKVKKINYTGVYFLGVSILLSVTYAIFTNYIFREINIILIPLTLATSLYMINFSDIRLKGEDLLNNVIPNITIGIFINPHVGMIGKLFKNREDFNFKNSKYRGVIKGVIISIPLLIFLIVLLSSADEIFASIFEDTINNMINAISLIRTGGVLLKLIVFALVFIYIYYLFSSFKFMVKRTYKMTVTKLDKSMVNTILVLVNVLYLVFTYVQIKYLYIKVSNFNLSPAEYSSYARNGFFQLIAVVVLNIMIILYFKNRIDNSKLTCSLNTLMTILSFNMGLTSLYKMRLYIREFGMTQLRFVTSIFMIFILIMLVLIAVSLWKKIELFKYCIIIGSIIYLGINFCNMDKMIAEYNLNAKGKGVDIEYLSTLSLDSYDVVLKAYEQGKISKEQFMQYKEQKQLTSQWYEYNYYNDK
ncbi:DUF4153 domain-containing protein [Clostridium mediterraneense]|uniref:DUF4153 domain-containing protein n=1 Tax=Clostridium mediterraneense TaxID=1805472 RepID=UPI000A017A85|nr:DUF4173 domain-containing protein [Clostridium mediterraneense]